MDLIKINEHIHRIVLPYKDIFTTVYVISTEQGIVLFDAASYETDLDDHIQPALDTLGITESMVQYIFISHKHKDHVGCLRPMISRYSQAAILSRSLELAEMYADCNVICPEAGDTVLDILKVVTIPGHTSDSCGLLDTRTNTLISGDSLQVYGIRGSGDWAANISLPVKHFAALKKLHTLKIECIVAAHDYQPYGFRANGKKEVARMIDACATPLLRVQQMILDNPDLNDAEICALYNINPDEPTIQEKVVAAVRSAMSDGLLA
jgi:glyoxylase-like metal-dependent hydrolase (beta-lactamase superfamily II)